MPGNLEFVGSVGYSFNSPNVTITCDRIRNNDDTQSGGILVTLYNTSKRQVNGFGNSNIVASFKLNALQGEYAYINVSRTVCMDADVVYPWMCLTVSENFAQKGFVQSDIREFSSRVKNEIYRRVPTPRKSSKNFFRITTLKNGVRTAANVAKAVGAVGSLFNPIFGVVGAIGSLVSSVLS